MAGRKITKYFLLISLLGFWSTPLLAQELSRQTYGGEYNYSINSVECLSKEKRAEIIKENKQVINLLTANYNKQFNKDKIQQSPAFGWPLKPSTQLDNYSYYGIANFVDHDSTYPNHLLDYYGGTRSYDRENGYNHQGTDIFTWPFAWYLMDNDLVEVVAMANGTIIGKEDGNYDRNCGFNEDDWNAIYILHADGVIAWYGHLKNGSVTSKSIGDTVEAGEYLGIVGSSGSSTAPHLHLEVYDSQSNLIDPWFGPYNPSITESWWEDQKPYYDSKVNKIATHTDWPVFPDCPQQEISYLEDDFQQGDTVYFVTYYQDQLKDQVSYYTITSPENIVLADWSHASSEEHYSASYWGWWFILPENASLGEWEFSVSFNQEIYKHNFSISSPTDLKNDKKKSYEFSLGQNYPNPFNPSTKIEFSIPNVGTSRDLSLQTKLIVYDILGREVENVINKKLTFGSYEVEFDGTNLPSGVYIYRLITGTFSQTKKMLLMK